MEMKNKNAMIGGLLAIIFVMAVGYAAFSTQLQIGGIASVTSRWDVHIKSITAGNPVGKASVKATPSVEGNGLLATFSTSLENPKDSLTYTIVVENAGNLDAKLNDIIFDRGASKAISFDYAGIVVGDVLPAGKTTSFTITVSYNDTAKQLSATDLTSDVRMLLAYVQAN